MAYFKSNASIVSQAVAGGFLRPRPVQSSCFFDAMMFGFASDHVAEWEEWINLLLGVWVLVSPWVLSFSA